MKSAERGLSCEGCSNELRVQFNQKREKQNWISYEAGYFFSRLFLLLALSLLLSRVLLTVCMNVEILARREASDIEIGIKMPLYQTQKQFITVYNATPTNRVDFQILINILSTKVYFILINIYNTLIQRENLETLNLASTGFYSKLR